MSNDLKVSVINTLKKHSITVNGTKVDAGNTGQVPITLNVTVNDPEVPTGLYYEIKSGKRHTESVDTFTITLPSDFFSKNFDIGDGPPNVTIGDESSGGY